MSQAIALTDLDWAEDAVATIIGLTRAGGQMTADDLRAELHPAPTPAMYGAAFQAARASGHIRVVGYRTSSTPTRRHGLLRVWAATTKETNK